MNIKDVRRNILTVSLLVSTALLSFSQNLTGDWKGKLVLGAGRELPLVFHISTADNSVSLDSPTQGAFGILCDIKYISADSLSIAIPKLMVNYSAKYQNNTLAGLFKQGGAHLPLNLERGIIAKPKRPQTPILPSTYKTEEVNIVSEVPDVTLSGTLTLPESVGKSTPVVVMVTGSGLQNRDEEILEHKPFAVIADYLAKNGIASLRYDDRGFGKSTGDVSNATTKDFAQDAQAVIDWIRKNKKFAKLGLLGHSEGGMIAYMLCKDKKKAPDFIISIAGPSVSGEQILEFQNIDALAKAGIKENQAKSIFRSKMPELNKNPWMAFFLQYDPKEDLSALKQPALLIYGEKDTQVPPSLNLEPARSYAKGAEVICYPELNHLMQHATTGDVSEYGQIEETFAPEVLIKIVEFIHKQK